jgi:hypothetical protein
LSNEEDMETVWQLFTWLLVKFAVPGAFVTYTSCGNLAVVYLTVPFLQMVG